MPVFREHALAHQLLDGVRGLEIGAAVSLTDVADVLGGLYRNRVRAGSTPSTSGTGDRYDAGKLS